MPVKSLSQGLNVDLAQPGLEPETSWSQSTSDYNSDKNFELMWDLQDSLKVF